MPEPTMRPDVRAFLDMLGQQSRPPFAKETIAAMRPLAPAGMAMLDLPVGELAVTRDVAVPGPAGRIPTRLFDARAEREAGPVAVFFHGGGYVIGNIDTHAAMAAEIARALDLPVISVDYRLAPEDPWPAAVDDGEAAARWIVANGAAYGRSFTGLVLAGDSAGGNLALVTALALRDAPAATPLRFILAIYPGTDPHGSYESNDAFSAGFGLDAPEMAFFRDSYASDPAHWRASPLRGELAGLPPTLVVTAGLDPLRDQGRAYAAKSVMAGVTTGYVEVPGTIHGFLAYRRAMPSSVADFAHVLDVARAMLAGATAG